MAKANPPVLNNNLNECIHFTLPFSTEKIHIFVVYIHPCSDIEPNIFTKASLYKHALMVGDFNINRRKKQQLKNFLENSDFEQRHTPPTFLMPQNPDSTPDILLHTMNLRDNVKNINLTNELGSDHLSITFNIDLNQIQHTPQTPMNTSNKLNLNRTNTDQVKNYIDNYISSQSEPITIDQLQAQISLAVQKFTPELKRSYYAHTLPKFVLKLIKHKRELYRLYTRTQNTDLKKNINSLNKNVKRLIYQYRQNKWLETCQEIERDQGKTYWRKIKKLAKYKKNNPITNINENGNELLTDKDKADAFARHYRWAFGSSTNPKFDNNNFNLVNEWYKDFFGSNNNVKMQPT
ncbi:uncharacterized protein [Euwallacea fornicatus]|uniref:uncharacterized protein n=1 Tax=Euwallacea fornicatus TaxID=995702 RepID=UPI00338D779B